jgi:hypothetical protein
VRVTVRVRAKAHRHGTALTSHISESTQSDNESDVFGDLDERVPNAFDWKSTSADWVANFTQHDMTTRIPERGVLHAFLFCERSSRIYARSGVSSMAGSGTSTGATGSGTSSRFGSDGSSGLSVRVMRAQYLVHPCSNHGPSSGPSQSAARRPPTAQTNLATLRSALNRRPSEVPT